MKNYAMSLAIAFLSLGLMSIGFNLNGNTATATPASFNAGPEEPTIVWYGTSQHSMRIGESDSYAMLLRAWSDGKVEAKKICTGRFCPPNDGFQSGTWEVVAFANEGLNARADINFDSRVNAEDLGIMLAAWGDAPRNDLPPSDCPLGLIP